MTKDTEVEDAVPRKRSGGVSRVLRWAVFPVAGVIVASAAHELRGALLRNARGPGWGSLESWLPTIIPSYADYTVAPWPMLIWLGLLVTLGLALSAFSVLLLGDHRDHRRWWLRGALLWISVIVSAIGAVGLAQIGEWLLAIESYGGFGGSHIRTFTLPALQEAVQWGALWGWIPALAAALCYAPPLRQRRRGRRALAVLALFLAAVVAGAGLAAATRGAALSARTEVAQNEEPASSATPTFAPTDPPSETAESSAPDFTGRCAAEDITVTIVTVNAALGSRYLRLGALNTSSETCALQGLPDLAFANEDVNSVRPTLIARDSTVNGDALDGSPTALSPGEMAYADVIWRAPTGRPAETTVFIAPWAGAPRTTDTEALDIVDDGEMQLTTWYRK